MAHLVSPETCHPAHSAGPAGVPGTWWGRTSAASTEVSPGCREQEDR